MPQALLGNRPHPNMLLFTEAFSAAARPVMKAFLTVSVVYAKKLCTLETKYNFLFHYSSRYERSNYVWLRIWLQTFPLVGLFVAYRHTLSDVNSCQIINSAVQRSGGVAAESGDMTSRTCEQV